MREKDIYIERDRNIYIYICVCVCACACVHVRCTIFDVHGSFRIGKMVRVFANDPGDGVQSQDKLYQRLNKWFLVPSSLTKHFQV